MRQLYGVGGIAHLRRGGGRGEIVHGASDLDFFLVLDEMPAEAEMKFLKIFWMRARSNICQILAMK